MTTIVYKVGGSLLTLPDLAVRVQNVLARERGCRPLLVAGGGAVADVVRGWDQLHRLGEEGAHRLALRSMMLNEALLEQLLPRAQLISTRSCARQAWESSRLPILSAHEFLRAEETAAQTPLPHSWDVTSDSIAAWITLVWPADRLVLLKSTSLPEQADRTTALEMVDRYFPHLASQLPAVDCIDLRADEPTVVNWPR